MARGKASRPGQVIRFLASTRLAVILLLSGIAAAGVSTLIPQGLDPAAYTSRYGVFAGSILHAVGMDRFFSSPLFITLSVLFSINLSACTFRRIRLRIRSGTFPISGPDLIHIGCLLLIAAGLLSATLRREAIIYLTEGESARLPESYTVTLEQFDTIRYPNGAVRAWISTLRIGREGAIEEVHRLQVNRPASAGAIRLYQNSYQRLSALRITPDREEKADEGEALELLPGQEIRTDEGMFQYRGIDPAGIDLRRSPSYSERDIPLRFTFRDESGEKEIILHPGDRAGEFLIDTVVLRDLSGILAVRDPGVSTALIAALLILTGLVATLIEKIPRPDYKEEE